MFGKANDSSRQNAALAIRPEREEIINLDLNIKYNPTTLKIIKVDKENNEIAIPNTKFRLFDKTLKKDLGEYITNENGEIVINTINEFGYVLDNNEIEITEIEANEKYYLDKEKSTYILKIIPEKQNSITIENERIKGNIKIIKTSNMDNKLSGIRKNSPLKDTVFNILDIAGNIVDTVSTNEEGIAISKDLEKGKYYIKEIKSSKYYVLDSNMYEVEIKKHNETIELNIGNDNIKYMEELPNTGK